VRDEVLQRVEEERNILHIIKRRKANWIGHVLCRNSILQHSIEGGKRKRSYNMPRKNM
jgi:hypothetical protein